MKFGEIYNTGNYNSGTMQKGNYKSGEIQNTRVKTMIARFEVGRTYKTRSICDSDCIFSYTVLSRTKKRMTIQEDTGEISTKRYLHL